jgi:hypothetical protein
VSASPRRPRAKVDPELRRQLAQAPASRAGVVEAVLRLRAPVRRSGRSPELSTAKSAVHDTARELLARVADELGTAPSDYDFNVLPNLGYCVLKARAGFVERVLQQPEVVSASANRRD